MIVTKGLKAKSFFRNLIISLRRKEEEKKLLPRVPLVATGAQKKEILSYKIP